MDDNMKENEIKTTLAEVVKMYPNVEFINEIYAKEKHCTHPIIINTKKETFRWAESDHLRHFENRVGIRVNEVVILFQLLNHDKNSEIYRNYYKSIGSSLYGYWKGNNEDADYYKPNLWQKFLNKLREKIQ